jgi:2-C-methyl-D-erythritol 4-phosphate cytidylyltransferase
VSAESKAKKESGVSNGRVGLALLAGGAGLRLKSGTPKAFVQVAGLPLFMHSLLAFDAMPAITSIRVALAPAEGQRLEDALSRVTLKAFKGWVAGGAERCDSALSALRALEQEAPDFVLIHDAARPIVDTAEVEGVLEALKSHGGAFLAAPCVDTLWRVSGLSADGVVDRTPLVRALTPQGFRYALIREAYERGVAEGFAGTDDAAYARRLSADVVWVRGSHRNLKVTHPEDLALAESLLRGSRWT